VELSEEELVREKKVKLEMLLQLRHLAAVPRVQQPAAEEEEEEEEEEGITQAATAAEVAAAVVEAAEAAAAEMEMDVDSRGSSSPAWWRGRPSPTT
jgi:hypothetical protein